MKGITISFIVSIAFNQFDSVIRISLQSGEYLRMGFEEFLRGKGRLQGKSKDGLRGS